MNVFQKFQKQIGRYADPFYREPLPATVRLGEEAGEVLGVIKRIERRGRLTDAQKKALEGELGDVLSSVACICECYRLDMSEIAKAQIRKETIKAEKSGRF